VTPVALILIRSFQGMARLAPVLDADGRAHLSRDLASRAVTAASSAGAEPMVVTGDHTVASWADQLGMAVIADPGGGLDAAANAGVEATEGGPWIVLHADLPAVTGEDVAVMLSAMGEIPVLAPSKDGGTSAIAATAPFPFRFGPRSFHRHLAAVAGRAHVIVRRGLAIDIDRPEDLLAWTRLAPHLTSPQ
jgi:2-phospho-L-lactate guanylyltransferase